MGVLDSSIVRSLASSVLNGALADEWKCDVDSGVASILYRLPVGGEVLVNFARLLKTPRAARLTEALRLPDKTQYELCLLCEYLSCDGLFEYGLQDTQMLYANVCRTQEYLEGYGHPPLFAHLSCSPERLFSLAAPYTIPQPRDLPMPDVFIVLEGHERAAAVAFHPNGKRLVSCDWLSKTNFWRVEEGDLASSEANGGRRIAFNNAGTQIVRAEDDGISLLDANGKVMGRIRTGECVVAVAFSSDDQFIAGLVGDNAVVHVWSVKTGVPIYTLHIPSSRVHGMAFSPCGSLIATGDHGGLINLWDVATEKSVAQWKSTARDELVTSMAFSTDGKWLVCGTESGAVVLSDVRDHSISKTLQNSESIAQKINAVAFSPDGQIVVACTDDHRIEMWDVKTGQHLRKVVDHSAGVYDVAFSRDGRYLASGGTDGTIIVRDVSRGLAEAQLLLLIKAGRAPQMHTQEQAERLEKICSTLPPDLQKFVCSKLIAVSEPVTLQLDAQETAEHTDTGAAIIHQASDGAEASASRCNAQLSRKYKVVEESTCCGSIL